MENKKPKYGIEPEHDFKCETSIQLRLVDIDTVGHVNNSVYFNLFDLAKSDYFEKVTGIATDPTKINVVIVNINCNFLAQTLFGENVAVRTQTEKIGDKSFTLIQELVNPDTGQVKCICRQTLVYLDPETHEPISVPQQWRQSISNYENRTF